MFEIFSFLISSSTSALHKPTCMTGRPSALERATMNGAKLTPRCHQQPTAQEHQRSQDREHRKGRASAVLHSEPKTQVRGVTLLFSLLMNNPPIIIHHDEKYWEVVLWLLPTTAKVISFSSLTCVQINYQCKRQNAWRNATHFIFAPGENYLQLQ